MDYPFEEPLLPERIKRELKEMRTLLPDLQAEIQHLVADGANATTVERWSGTSAATGNRVEGTVFHLFRFEDGQVVEERSEGWGWLDALKHSQTALPPMDALARLYTTRIWTFQPGRGGIASLLPCGNRAVRDTQYSRYQANDCAGRLEHPPKCDCYA